VKTKESLGKEKPNSPILDSWTDLKLLTRRQEACEILKIGISSLDQIPEIELPRVRIGRSVRFTKAALTEYISNKVKRGDK